MPGPSQVYEIVVHPDLLADPDDLGPVLEALQEVQRAELDDIGLLMQQQQIENFDTQGATFGEPWQELKVSTLREKARLGFPEQSLVRAGRIASEIGATMVIGETSVTTGLDLGEAPEARFAQPSALGGGNDGTGRTPPRVLVALTEEELGTVHEIIQRYVAEATGADAQAVEIVRAQE